MNAHPPQGAGERSFEGSRIPIHLDNGFEVKNATVIAADIEADNGIIHILDRVILMG
jgi:uncharacterized surface protein with fasciclin (FAS1) repeats